MSNKTPSGRFLNIDELFAFISVDEEGEGICGFIFTDGDIFMPMVGADMDRVNSLKEMAQKISNHSGKEIKVCRFSVREELEIITPKGEEHG